MDFKKWIEGFSKKINPVIAVAAEIDQKYVVGNVPGSAGAINDLVVSLVIAAEHKYSEDQAAQKKADVVGQLVTQGILPNLNGQPLPAGYLEALSKYVDSTKSNLNFLHATDELLQPKPQNAS